MTRFIDAKTFMQTNRKYEPGLFIPVDAVAVHPHNIATNDNSDIYSSWQSKAKSIGRMFFANSDDLKEYCFGKWDGTDHTDETEINSQGQTIMCSEIRPYILPTEGWISYLQNKKVLASLKNGVNAILPEEPLAHIFSGYEENFKKEYEKFYSEPWQPASSSEIALYNTAFLKALLYKKLETEMMIFTKKWASVENKEISFVIPIHSIFSNKVSDIVAPLGLSIQKNGFDGYVGQVWTGPVNWCLDSYNSPEKSFFACAFILYDYFAQLTTGTDKKLWLEVDPVEDDPNHDWKKFKQWYQYCTTAMLMMKDIDSYEVIPWPERIFQTNSFTPGRIDFAKEPAPKHFLNAILSATQVLQDIPSGGKWLGDCEESKIAIAIADSTMYQKSPNPALQGLFGLRMPLLQKGISVSSFIMERAGDLNYINKFKIIVISFEDWKPYKEEMITHVAQWVFNGGNLLIVGSSGDSLDREKSFWWHKKGFASPLDALLNELGCKANQTQWKYGQGSVIYEFTSPRNFSDPVIGKDIYITLLKKLSADAGIDFPKETGHFAVKRGDYIIAHAETSEFQFHGHFIDVFKPEFNLIKDIQLNKTQSGIFKDVSDIIKINKNPKLLHTTYRKIYEEYLDGILKIFIKGPEDTEITARIFKGSLNVKSISAMSEGCSIGLNRIDDDCHTFRLVCANRSQGVLITVTFR